MSARSLDRVGVPTPSVQFAERAPKFAVEPGTAQDFVLVGTNATSGGTAHTMGAWAQMIAATSADVYGILAVVTTNAAPGTNTSGLADIGIGGAGAETVIVPYVDIGFEGTNSGVVRAKHIPVFIPAGSRLAWRWQSARTSTATGLTLCTSLNIPAWYSQGPHPSALVSYGHNAANSNMTALTAPGSLNTKGAWTELTSATNEALQALMVQANGGASNTYTSSTMYVDIAVGAAGQEQAVITNANFQTHSSEYVQTAFASGRTYAVSIPKGARISARYSRSATQGLTCSVIGVPR